MNILPLPDAAQLLGVPATRLRQLLTDARIQAARLPFGRGAWLLSYENVVHAAELLQVAPPPPAAFVTAAVSQLKPTDGANG